MEKWLPILDYAVLKGISTSTIRRYIKSKKVIYKIEKGRYLILDDGVLISSDEFSNSDFNTESSESKTWDGARPTVNSGSLHSVKQAVHGVSSRTSDDTHFSAQKAAQNAALNTYVRELEKSLAKMQEQNDELKMLVAIYEEKLAQRDH